MYEKDADLLDLFAEYQRSGNRSRRTIESRLSLLRGLATRQKVDLLEATVFHLRRDIGRDGIAPSTMATTRGAFLAFYGFLHDEGLRTDNPALRLPVVQVPKHRPRPYTPGDVDLLLSTGAYKRTRAMILLSAYAGLRAAEIAAVHANDFNLDAGVLKVVGKGSRTDYLPLHPSLVELAPTMGTGWWFPARRGREGHIHGRSVSTLLTNAKKRAGISDSKLTGHSLRHHFGTELVRRGANIRAVQELMRHESLQTTQRYTEVLDEDRREALSVLPPRAIPTRSGRRAA
ncbi:tyrosine-type recombinase/integrase [Microbacterium maritypicum]